MEKLRRVEVTSPINRGVGVFKRITGRGGWYAEKITIKGITIYIADIPEPKPTIFKRINDSIPTQYPEHHLIRGSTFKIQRIWDEMIRRHEYGFIVENIR